MSSSWSSLNQQYKKLFKTKETYQWQNLLIKDLSEVKLKDLKLNIKKTSLVDRAIKEILLEWKQLGFNWQPNFWFSTEWFYPEGAKGIAIPFYLASSKLMSLEKYIIA